MPLDSVSVYVGASAITISVLFGLVILLTVQIQNLKKLHTTKEDKKK